LVEVVFDEMTFRSLRTLPGPLKKQQQENKFLAIAAIIYVEMRQQIVRAFVES